MRFILDKKFDVAVVGGGHAGIEAAWLCAKMGVKTILVTMDSTKIGAMHCNPSIGGLGKGHMVFELAALGGLMPWLCSRTHLQARMLNTSKGPAVQGLRLQIDKIAYQNLASKTMTSTKNLTVLSDEVVEVLATKDQDGKSRVTGMKMASGNEISVGAIVIATGTFLRSKIFIGKQLENFEGVFPEISKNLSGSLEEITGAKIDRLKTGTPPRLLKDSLDFSKFDLQPAHDLDFLFEFEPKKSTTLTECFLTKTNEQTHKVILDNLNKSALFTGDILSVGPRYCPSIEAKLIKFPDKNSHHIFVEPETLDGNLIYPAGLSNGLPSDIQEQFIRTIEGFGNAIIARPGFQIEYDFFQPTGLDNTLGVKNVDGLFFAGQINGTTGYEEAACQGAVAGINAARFVMQKSPCLMQRSQSYIGVMIDDLVTLGVSEPYRMFTSRAERRLIMRQDNAFSRLMPEARELGLVDDSLWDKFCREEELVKKAWNYIGRGKEKQASIFKLLNVHQLDDDQKELVKTRLKDDLELPEDEVEIISGRVLARLHSMVRYDGYIDREELEVDRMKKYGRIKIPDDFNYRGIQGLRRELQEKLEKARPKNVGQAMLISGMTPAAASLLAIMVGKRDKKCEL